VTLNHLPDQRPPSISALLAMMAGASVFSILSTNGKPGAPIAAARVLS
jgi:hypothetical protein